MKNLVMGSIGVWDWLKPQCKSGIIVVLGIAFVLYGAIEVCKALDIAVSDGDKVRS